MAEAMAFNRNCLGDVGSPLSALELPDDALRYIRFYRDNNRHYAATQPVADVALLRSFPSMAYNSLGPHLETTLMEQLLIQHKIPFDLIFDQHWIDLSKYRAVILADQESLSDRAVEQLREYVRGGGGLVATGRTSLYNDWRRRRNDYGLADVLGIRLAPGVRCRRRNRGAFGKGRTAYVPAVTPGRAGRGHGVPVTRQFAGRGIRLRQRGTGSCRRMRRKLWPPSGTRQVRRFSIEFEHAPLTTVMELTRQ